MSAPHAHEAEAGPTVSPFKAVYAHLDACLEGVAGLQKAGVEGYTVLSPMPRHEIEELIYKGEPSPVRWFTLAGAIFGCCMVFSLASLTHANWPMIIPGGKPLVSVPPFLVISFEGTILWGSLMTLNGLLINCRLPAMDLPVETHDPRFSRECFGIVVQNVPAARADTVKSILEHSGAIEVTGGAAEGAHA
jgi:molybdopterin-containing oxidoreductase family membrane subunit